MNVEQKNIPLALFITLVTVLCVPVLFPSMRIMFFAPFLVILYYQKSFLTCLWSAFLAGLLLDLLSAHTHLGLYAGNYMLTTWVLYNQRRNFFADNLSTLPLMTFQFAVASTLIEWGSLLAFERKLEFSLSWVMTDLFLMPMLDAVYCFVVFVIPALIFSRPKIGFKR